jgi:hypothetical protein
LSLVRKERDGVWVEFSDGHSRRWRRDICAGAAKKGDLDLLSGGRGDVSRNRNCGWLGDGESDGVWELVWVGGVKNLPIADLRIEAAMGLNQVELVMDVEDELGISIQAEDEYGQAVNTVGAFYDLVLRIVREKGASELLRRAELEQYVWDVVTRLAAKCGHGPKAAQITRETRFIEDLGYS